MRERNAKSQKTQPPTSTAGATPKSTGEAAGARVSAPVVVETSAIGERGVMKPSERRRPRWPRYPPKVNSLQQQASDLILYLLDREGVPYRSLALSEEVIRGLSRPITMEQLDTICADLGYNVALKASTAVHAFYRNCDSRSPGESQMKGLMGRKEIDRKLIARSEHIRGILSSLRADDVAETVERALTQERERTPAPRSARPLEETEE